MRKNMESMSRDYGIPLSMDHSGGHCGPSRKVTEDSRRK